MKEVRKIAHKVIFLILDMLVFTHQMVRKIILPTRHRKGNVLSSLLSFFVGLLERVVSFEKSVLRQPVVFRHKYVKQGLMLAAGFLFLLSSIEWTVGQSSVVRVNETQVVLTNGLANDAVTVLARRHMDSYAPLSERDLFISGYPSYKTAYPVSDGPITHKRWLRYCILRI